MPDIVPNWHPAAVHFPIALGMTTVLLLVAARLNPARDSFSAAARLLLTSDFGDGRELEHCTVAADPTATLACRCGACDVPARDAFAMVRADRDCALILGGTIDGEATTDVLRFCWSDRPWPAATAAAP